MNGLELEDRLSHLPSMITFDPESLEAGEVSVITCNIKATAEGALEKLQNCNIRNNNKRSKSQRTLLSRKKESSIYDSDKYPSLPFCENDASRINSNSGEGEGTTTGTSQQRISHNRSEGVPKKPERSLSNASELADSLGRLPTMISVDPQAPEVGCVSVITCNIKDNNTEEGRPAVTKPAKSSRKDRGNHSQRSSRSSGNSQNTKSFKTSRSVSSKSEGLADGLSRLPTIVSVDPQASEVNDVSVITCNIKPIDESKQKKSKTKAPKDDNRERRNSRNKLSSQKRNSLLSPIKEKSDQPRETSEVPMKDPLLMKSALPHMSLELEDRLSILPSMITVDPQAPEAGCVSVITCNIKAADDHDTSMKPKSTTRNSGSGGRSQRKSCCIIVEDHNDGENNSRSSDPHKSMSKELEKIQPSKNELISDSLNHLPTMISIDPQSAKVGCDSAITFKVNKEKKDSNEDIKKMKTKASSQGEGKNNNNHCQRDPNTSSTQPQNNTLLNKEKSSRDSSAESSSSFTEGDEVIKPKRKVSRRSSCTETTFINSSESSKHRRQQRRSSNSQTVSTSETRSTAESSSSGCAQSSNYENDTFENQQSKRKVSRRSSCTGASSEASKHRKQQRRSSYTQTISSSEFRQQSKREHCGKNHSCRDSNDLKRRSNRKTRSKTNHTESKHHDRQSSTKSSRSKGERKDSNKDRVTSSHHRRQPTERKTGCEKKRSSMENHRHSSKKNPEHRTKRRNSMHSSGNKDKSIRSSNRSEHESIEPGSTIRGRSLYLSRSSSESSLLSDNYMKPNKISLITSKVKLGPGNLHYLKSLSERFHRCQVSRANSERSFFMSDRVLENSNTLLFSTSTNKESTPNPQDNSKCSDKCSSADKSNPRRNLHRSNSESSIFIDKPQDTSLSSVLFTPSQKGNETKPVVINKQQILPDSTGCALRKLMNSLDPNKLPPSLNRSNSESSFFTASKTSSNNTAESKMSDKRKSEKVKNDNTQRKTKNGPNQCASNQIEDRGYTRGLKRNMSVPDLFENRDTIVRPGLLPSTTRVSPKSRIFSRQGSVLELVDSIKQSQLVYPQTVQPQAKNKIEWRQLDIKAPLTDYPRSKGKVQHPAAAQQGEDDLLETDNNNWASELEMLTCTNLSADNDGPSSVAAGHFREHFSSKANFNLKLSAPRSVFQQYSMMKQKSYSQINL